MSVFALCIYGVPCDSVVVEYEDSGSWYVGRVGIPVGGKPPGNRWLNAAS